VRRAIVPLLLLWALVATILAIRPWDAPTVPMPADPRADVSEVERLRSRVAELERRETAIEPEKPDPVPAGEPAARKTDARSFGEAADLLLAKYRRCRDTGKTGERKAALGELVSLAERDRSIHLVWAVLLREAVDEDEADEMEGWIGNVTSFDPGGPLDREFRAGLRDLMLHGIDPFRRATAAGLLFWIAQPAAEDVHAALMAIQTERDEEARGRILGDMGTPEARRVASVGDAALYVKLVREAMDAGETYLAGTLAGWSEDQADFDRLREKFEATKDISLMDAFMGGRPLTKGREAECRAVLAAVILNPASSSTLRTRAVTYLDRLRPWDAATIEAVRQYKESPR
jgi:hypothetical protein